MSRTALLVMMMGVLMTGCGGGGGSGHSAAPTAAGAGAGPAASDTSTSTADTGTVSRFERTLSTTVNVPVVFELEVSDPDSVVHTNWYLPVTGSIEFVGVRFTGVYVPPIDYQGQARFGIEIERSDGTRERTDVTVTIAALERLHYPWSCESPRLSDEPVLRLAAHPGILGALVALQRDGLALVGLSSRDGGATWQRGETLAESAVHELRYDPAADGVVIASGESGTWRSVDDGQSWRLDPTATMPVVDASASYRLAGSRLFRSDDGGASEYLVASHATSLLDLETDPRNPRRQYVLATDGLKTLFRDGGPGLDPSQEGERMVPVAAELGDALHDMTVDASGRVLVGGEGGIYCVEGDRPFHPGGANNAIHVGTSALLGELPTAYVSVEPVTEPTELTVWLKSTQLVNAQPGVLAVDPVVIHERILGTGEPASLDFPLAVARSGIYEVAAVLRTEHGVVARGQSALVVEAADGSPARAELALDVVEASTLDGARRFQARIAHTSGESAANVVLHIQASADGRVQPVESVSDAAVCRAAAEGFRCLLDGALAPGEERLVEFLLRARPGTMPDVRAAVSAGVREERLDDNVWSSNSNATGSDLAIQGRSVLGNPEPGREVVLELEVVNNGAFAGDARIDGILELIPNYRALHHGDWILMADGGECVQPSRYCPVGGCDEILTDQQHFSCTFDAPLLVGEARHVRIGLHAGDAGEVIRATALASGGWDPSGIGNLSSVQVKAGEPNPDPVLPPAGNGSDDYGQSDRCQGLLVLITWGACLDW